MRGNPADEAANARDLRLLKGPVPASRGPPLPPIAQTRVRAACNPVDEPLDKLEPGFQQTTRFDPPDLASPYGCHLCEIEVDPMRVAQKD